MKIGLTYGHVASNIGDLAINRGMMNILRDLEPEADVHVVLLNPNPDYQEAAQASFESELKVTFTELNTRPKRLRERHGGEHELSKLMSYIFDPQMFLHDCGLADRDILLFNPGEHLFSYKDDDRPDMLWRLLPAFAAAQAGIPFLVPPVTAGPFENTDASRLIKTFLSLCADVAVRESRSTAHIEPLLSGRSAPCLLDPAFFLNPSALPNEVDSSASPRLGIVMRLADVGLRIGGAQNSRNLRDFAEDSFQQNLAFDAAVTAARTFLAERSDGEVDLMVQTKQDRDLAAAVKSALEVQFGAGVVSIVQPESIESYLAALRRTSLVVSSRFHGCIFACVADVPVIGCYFESHGHKMPGLFELLDRRESCLNLSAQSTEVLAEVMRHKLSDRGEDARLSMQLGRKVESLRRRTRYWVRRALRQPARDVSREELAEARIEYLRHVDRVRHHAVSAYLAGLKTKSRSDPSVLTVADSSIFGVFNELATLHQKAVTQLTHMKNSRSYRLTVLLRESVRSPWLIPLLPIRLLIWVGLEMTSERSRNLRRIEKTIARGEMACDEIFRKHLKGSVLRKLRKTRGTEAIEASVVQEKPALVRQRVLSACETIVQRLHARGVPRSVGNGVAGLFRLAAGSRLTAHLIQQTSEQAGDLHTRERRLGYMVKLESDTGPRIWRKRWENVRSQLKLLKQGYARPKRVPVIARNNGNFAKQRTLMYLHNSIPFFSGGYATRSHGVLSAVRESGYEPTALTRLGFPWDLPQRDNDPSPGELPDPEVFDGINYHRLPPNGNGRYDLPLENYLDASAEALETFLERHPVDLIHAASFASTCGLPAMKAAYRLGLPFVYEVRGLHYLTKLSRFPEWAGSDECELDIRLEREAAEAADVVLTLTHAMKDELTRIGVDESKIRVFPNCVDPERFRPVPRNETLARKLGINDAVVIGYIGSFVHYEGLDTLLQAFARARNDSTRPLKLLMVGDGDESDRLHRLAKELNLGDSILFTGRLPHSAVADYYSLVDIAPFPRVSIPVCELVSPMKPFEAMAMQKTVVVSSVRALNEIVQDQVTGFVFEKDNLDDFVRVLTEAIENEERRREIGVAAREWVTAHRTWSTISEQVKEIYGSLIPKTASKRTAVPVV